MQMNLRTTISAYPKLSESILSDYAKKEDLTETAENLKQQLDATAETIRTETAENYVPEVADRESDKVYARNGKDRKWVELQDSAEASDIEIYFGSNDQLQMDDIAEVQSLAEHGLVAKGSKSFDLTYNQEEAGKLWICTTQPIKAVKWNGYLWGDYSVQRDKVVDEATGKSYYCYSSNEILLENFWEFKILF